LPFKEGDRVVLVECPPPEYGYSDYISSYGRFESYGDGFAIIKDRRGVRRLINLRASTVIELREPFEEECF
jgi:hypothetical protein